MNHRMKSGALTLSLITLVACSDTAGLESSFEESLTLDVAMIVADAAIDEFGDLGLLFGSGAFLAPSGLSTRTLWTKSVPRYCFPFGRTVGRNFLCSLRACA